MRHTYASFALDAGVTLFELARLTGTSIKVIDDTYGHVVRDSHDRVRAALEAANRVHVERNVDLICFFSSGCVRAAL
jgi:integrase